MGRGNATTPIDWVTITGSASNDRPRSAKLYLVHGTHLNQLDVIAQLDAA